MKSKRVRKPVFFILFALILALAFTAFFGIEDYYGDTRKVYIKGAKDIRWGIDISGGVEAVFIPDIGKGTKVTDSEMDSAKLIIEKRLVSANITDYEVFEDTRNNQIIVRFPWEEGESSFDSQAAITTVEGLGKTAVLKFCKNQDSTDIILQGSADIKKATPAVNTQTNESVVQLKLTDEGKKKFADATAELVGQQISIWMDDEMISAPTVQEVIKTGDAQITLSSSGDKDTAVEAKELADTINAGNLPFALKPDNSKLQIISPSLGSNALRVMVIAGSIAFGVICLLMIIRYRLHGFIATIALLGQLAGTIACISGFFKGTSSFTLTIPGIAGIILSIGVGVDCNVIAAERIRDEFKKGKTIDGAIDSGFKNSLSAVIDGNMTIVIVSLVLMGAFGTNENFLAKILSPIMSIFGSSITGSIYSFGYTLLIGVIFNLIMGVLASKYMLKSVSQLKFLRKPVLYGGKKNG